MDALCWALTSETKIFTFYTHFYSFIHLSLFPDLFIPLLHPSPLSVFFSHELGGQGLDPIKYL